MAKPVPIMAKAVTKQSPEVVPPKAVPKSPPPVTCEALRTGTFMGQPLKVLLNTMRSTPVMHLYPANISGRTVKFWVYLSGQRGELGLKTLMKLYHRGLYFTFLDGEEGVFILSRMLGMESVPPVVRRTFSFGYLHELLHRAHMKEKASLFAQRVRTRDDVGAGALIYWIPGAPEFRYARPYLARMGSPGGFAPKLLPRMEQLSNMVILDYLSDNHDRLSGGNILRRKERLYFIDHGAAFAPPHTYSPHTSGALLSTLQRVNRTTLSHLRRLSREGLDACLGSFLAAQKRERILARRKELLNHIEKLVQQRGKGAFF